jgi:hypothetical protein
MTLGMDVIPTGRLPEYPSELRWTASHQVALGVLLVFQVVLYILMRQLLEEKASRQVAVNWK